MTAHDGSFTAVTAAAAAAATTTTSDTSHQLNGAVPLSDLTSVSSQICNASLALQQRFCNINDDATIDGKRQVPHGASPNVHRFTNSMFGLF